MEQQRGDYEAAASYLRSFLEYEPGSGDAHLQLAGIYVAQGDLDAAQTSLEDAAILSDDPLEPELAFGATAGSPGGLQRGGAAAVPVSRLTISVRSNASACWERKVNWRWSPVR